MCLSITSNHYKAFRILNIYLNKFLIAGIFDVNAVTEALNGDHVPVSTRPLMKPEEAVITEAGFELKGAPEDDDASDDVIDVEPEKKPTTEYEYYYVYYDEEGNVLDKSPPKTIHSATLNKIQDIPVSASSTTSTTNKIPTLNNHVQTGDTPTIYAQLSEDENESSSGGESEKSDEDTKNGDEDGMSIFGIPIPKIPFPILSFGLAPTTFSHGLLPIGRKGDPSADPDPKTGTRRKTGSLPEITRGPDSIDPIWLESLVNGAKAYFASGEENPESNKEEEIGENVSYNQYFPSSSVENYGYEEPKNPVIPLGSSEDIDYQNIPLLVTSETGYYPQKVPALKFDHPVEDHGNPLLDFPVQPIPELKRKQYHVNRVNQVNPVNHYPAGPVAEDGFIPLFLPDQTDPLRRRFQEPSPTLKPSTTQQLPEQGFTLPYYLQPKQPAYEQQSPAGNYPLVYRKPPQQLPENEFPIVYANPSQRRPITFEPESVMSTENDEIKTTSYPAVPENHQPKNYPIFETQPTEKSPTYQRPTKTPPSNDLTENEITTEEQKLAENEYYYVYEDLPESYQSPENVMAYLSNLGVNQISEESTTERKIPTLKVEEILTKSTTRSTTTVETTTTTTTSTTTTTTTAPQTQEVVYEYEYYYEYYDDPNHKREANDTPLLSEAIEQPIKDTTTEKSDFSIQNFISNLLNSREDQNSTQPLTTSTTEVTISTAGNTGSIQHPKGHLLPARPTIPIAIRTSTENYDSNYLENKRSTVEVETSNPRFAYGRSTTTVGQQQPSTPAYPFYPDRLDPGKIKPNSDNEVKWYYSNYNSDGLEPYVDPRHPRDQHVEAAKVQESTNSSQNIESYNFCFVILLSMSVYLNL